MFNFMKGLHLHRPTLRQHWKDLFLIERDLSHLVLSSKTLVLTLEAIRR